MILEGKITILCSNNRVTIEVRDVKSATCFLEIEISPENFTAALGRLGMVECSLDARGLERVGKRLEMKELVFPVPDRKRNIAIEEAQGHIPEGWIADISYNSQNSFYRMGEQWYARTTLRRWVDELVE